MKKPDPRDAARLIGQQLRDTPATLVDDDDDTDDIDDIVRGLVGERGANWGDE